MKRDLAITIPSRTLDRLLRKAAASYGSRNLCDRRPHALFIQQEDRAELPSFIEHLTNLVGLDSKIRFADTSFEVERRFFDPHPDVVVVERMEMLSMAERSRLAVAFVNPRATRPPLTLFLITVPLGTLMTTGMLEPALSMRIMDTLVWPSMNERRREWRLLFEAYVEKLQKMHGHSDHAVDSKTHEKLSRFWQEHPPKSVRDIQLLAERTVEETAEVSVAAQ